MDSSVDEGSTESGLGLDALYAIKTTYTPARICILATLAVTSLAYIASPIYFLGWSWLTGRDQTKDSKNLVLSIGSGCYYLIFALVIIIAARTRKTLQPFKSMSFSLLCISALCGLTLRLWIVVFAAMISHEFMDVAQLCRVTRWMVALLYPGLVLPYLLRALRLHVIFSRIAGPHDAELSQSSEISRLLAPRAEAMVAATSLGSVPLEPEFYPTRCLINWLLLGMMPFVAFAVIDATFKTELIPTFAECVVIRDSSTLSNVFKSVVLHGGEAIILAVAVALCWKAGPAFSIRSELLAVLSVDVVIAVIQVLDAAGIGYPDGGGYTRYLTAARVAILFVVSMVRPLYMSFVPLHEIQPLIASGASVRTMQGLLQNEHSLCAVEDYLYANGGEQLLLFYKQVAFFPDLPRKQTEAAELLYNDFLTRRESRSSVSTVGRTLVVDIVSTHVKENIRLALEHSRTHGEPLSPSLFDSAREEVLAVLQERFFSSFKETAAYEALLNQEKHRKVVDNRLRQSQML